MPKPDIVAALWRFPVKSMQGESVAELAVTDTGVAGDRAWGIFDVEGGDIASAKNVQLFPQLMQCRARFLAMPHAHRPAPHVQIELPDGRRLRSDAQHVDHDLSAFFGRPVLLVRAPAGMQTYKQYTERTRTRLRLEMPVSAAPCGALRDAFQMSLITTSTLDALQLRQPSSVFDARRFRMNIIAHTAQPGFVENAWPGRTVALGSDCRLQATVPDPRCIMTTLPQDDLMHDTAILKAIGQHNRQSVAGLGLRPCAGVYADVLQSGVVRVGDHVAVLS